jgi:hypothetical protein
MHLLLLIILSIFGIQLLSVLWVWWKISKEGPWIV